jgi:hypothetical protein
MADSRERVEHPEITRAELDELRRELQDAREQNALLTASQDDRCSFRPGPIVTNVVSGFIVAGGIAILVVASDILKTHAPLSVWLVLSGAFGLGTTLIVDYSNRFPPKRANRVLAIGAVGVVVAGVVTTAIANATGAIGAGESAGTMTYVSFGVGAVVALSLGVVSDLGWLGRIWKT